MPEMPVPQPCPYPNCTGEVTHPAESCTACGGGIGWKKDPNHNGGLKPVSRPSGG